LPSALTVIVAVPTLLAVTRPEADTAAVAAALDAYVADVTDASDGFMAGTI